MQIFIKLESAGTIMTIDVEPSDSVAAVKQKIQDRGGPLVPMQCLTYDGKEFSDDLSLEDYNIKKEFTLHVTPRCATGSKPTTPSKPVMVVKHLRYWKNGRRLTDLEDHEAPPTGSYDFCERFEGVEVKWEGRPFKNHIFHDHEELVLMVLLRERLLRSHPKSIAFLYRLRCIGAKLPELETFARFLTGESMDSLDISLLHSCYVEHIRSRAQLCALTASLEGFDDQHIFVEIEEETLRSEKVSESTSEKSITIPEKALSVEPAAHLTEEQQSVSIPAPPQTRPVFVRMVNPAIFVDQLDVTVNASGVAEGAEGAEGAPRPPPTGEEIVPMPLFTLPTDSQMRFNLARDRRWLVMSPLQLRTTPVVPCLTTDLEGSLSIFIGQGKGVGSDINLLCPSSCKEDNGSDIERSHDVDALMKVWIASGQQATASSEVLDFEVSEVVVVAVDCSHSMSKPLKKKKEYNGDDSDLDAFKVERILADLNFKLMAYSNESSGVWLGVQLLTTAFPSASATALFNASKKHYLHMIGQKRELEKQRIQSETDATSSLDTAGGAGSCSDIPDGFLCPITHSVMSDPVIASDGHTYERDAIERWLTTHMTSPMTGAQLPSKTFTSNFALRDAITQLKRSGNFMVRKMLSTTKQLFCVIYRGTRREYSAETAALAINSFLDSQVPRQKNAVRGGIYVVEDIDPEELEIARKKWTFKVDEHDPTLIYAIDQPVEILELQFERIGTISIPNYMTVLDLYLKLEPHHRADLIVISLKEENKGDGVLACVSDLECSEGLRSLATIFESPEERKGLKVYYWMRSDPDKDKGAELSKMMLAKSVFNSLVDRSASYNLPYAYGLLKFSTSVEELLPVQLSVELFRDAVKHLKPEGDTSLFDAIQKGVEMIGQYKGKRSSNCVSRILMLTDGEDTSSKEMTLRAVTKLLKEHNILLDIIAAGEDVDMKTLSQYPGDKFIVQTEQEAIMLSEMETFLCSSLRSVSKLYGRCGSVYRRSKHTDGFENDFDDKLAPPLSASVYVPKTAGPTHRDVIIKLQRDWVEIQKAANSCYSVQLVDEKLHHWKVTFTGPDGTPYEGGFFEMSLIAEGEFPSQPPDCRFFVPCVPHCNISVHGRVCHSVLGRNWSPTTSLKKVLDCIYGLFLSPEPDDPLQMILATLMHTDPEAYDETIRRTVLRDFLRSSDG